MLPFVPAQGVSAAARFSASSLRCTSWFERRARSAFSFFSCARATASPI
jgi:hypothetical protein